MTRYTLSQIIPVPMKTHRVVYREGQDPQNEILKWWQWRDRIFWVRSSVIGEIYG